MVGAGCTNGQSAESILRKYYNAIGGTENWNKINSIHTTFSLTSAGGEMHGSKTVLQGKGSKKEMNININGKNMVTYTVVTPTKGWFLTLLRVK